MNIGGQLGARSNGVRTTRDATPSDTYVDFEFRSRLLQKPIEPLFSEAARRMVAAFEARARKLYGRSGDG